MPGPVHSFGYNMGLYHGLVPSSQNIRNKLVDVIEKSNQRIDRWQVKTQMQSTNVDLKYTEQCF